MSKKITKNIISHKELFQKKGVKFILMNNTQRNLKELNIKEVNNIIDEYINFIESNEKDLDIYWRAIELLKILHNELINYLYTISNDKKERYACVLGSFINYIGMNLGIGYGLTYENLLSKFENKPINNI